MPTKVAEQIQAAQRTQRTTTVQRTPPCSLQLIIIDRYYYHHKFSGSILWTFPQSPTFGRRNCRYVPATGLLYLGTCDSYLATVVALAGRNAYLSARVHHDACKRPALSTTQYCAPWCTMAIARQNVGTCHGSSLVLSKRAPSKSVTSYAALCGSVPVRYCTGIDAAQQSL